MNNKTKIELLIDLAKGMEYRDDAQLETFLEQASIAIRNIFGWNNNKYWPYFENIRFKPASFFASEYEYQKSWRKGKRQMIDLLEAMLTDSNLEDNVYKASDFPEEQKKQEAGLIDDIKEIEEEIAVSLEEEEKNDETQQKMESLLISLTQTIDEFKNTVVKDVSANQESLVNEKKQDDLSEEDSYQERLITPGLAEELSNRVDDTSPFAGTRVFYVPGLNDAMNVQIYRFLTDHHLQLVVGDDPQQTRRSIAEQFNEFTNIQFAIVVLSGDNFMYSKLQTPTHAHLVPGQNVVFELGYLVGKLGRDRVIALYEEGDQIKRPTGFFDVFYIPYAQEGVWHHELRARLQAAQLVTPKTTPVQ